MLMQLVCLAVCVLPACSENSKLLLTQCGEPDYSLVIWRWYSGKVGACVCLRAGALCCVVTWWSPSNAPFHPLSSGAGTAARWVGVRELLCIDQAEAPIGVTTCGNRMQ